MRHEAIYNTHPDVKGISESPDGNWICINEEGNLVTIDKSKVDEEETKLQAEFDTQAYARNRASAYPSTGDQLDYIFHNGVAKWKTDMIEPVKAKYPKPS